MTSSTALKYVMGKHKIVEGVFGKFNPNSS